jgi:hypothetical protein
MPTPSEAFVVTFVLPPEVEVPITGAVFAVPVL